MTAQAKSKVEHAGKLNELALTHNAFKAQLEGKDDSHKDDLVDSILPNRVQDQAEMGQGEYLRLGVLFQRYQH